MDDQLKIAALCPHFQIAGIKISGNPGLPDPDAVGAGGIVSAQPERGSHIPRCAAGGQEKLSRPVLHMHRGAAAQCFPLIPQRIAAVDDQVCLCQIADGGQGHAHRTGKCRPFPRAFHPTTDRPQEQDQHKQTDPFSHPGTATCLFFHYFMLKILS